MTSNRSIEIVRSTLAVLFIGLLIITCLGILRPFLFPLAWATTIVIATWPMMLTVQRRCWNSRGLAVAIMSVALLLLLVLPLSFALGTLLNHAGDVGILLDRLKSSRLGASPEWFEKVPFLSEELSERWQHWSAITSQEFAEKVTPYVNKGVKWFVAQVGNLGMLLVQFLVMIVLAAVLYGHGEQASELVCGFSRRLGGNRGQEVVLLSAAAIRSVAIGIVGTAVIQSVFGGLGLILTGVPAVTLWIAVMMILCLVQIGPGVVLFPAVVWLYRTDQSTWATVLLVWSIVVALSDNFLRPLLIRRGAALPFLLILVGVIGGLIAFGVIGLFLGPVTLAVTYTLLMHWIREETSPSDVGEGTGGMAA
nr:AI-2E family transporter YdiK [uncultured Desulfobulbus sp.]